MAWVMNCDGCGRVFATAGLADGLCADCRDAQPAAADPVAVEAAPEGPAALEAARVEIELLTLERDDLQAEVEDLRAQLAERPVVQVDGHVGPLTTAAIVEAVAEAAPFACEGEPDAAPTRIPAKLGRAAGRIPDHLLLEMLNMSDAGSSTAEIASVLGLKPARVGAALDELKREAAA